MSEFEQPTPEQLDGFRDGDPIAIDEVATIVLPQLSRWALRQYGQLPAEDVLDTVNVVLAEVCSHHDRYDRTVSLFTTYVIHLLKLRLNDLYRTRQKIDEFEEFGPDTYEKAAAIPYNILEEPDTRVVRDVFFQEVERRLGACERDLLRQMREDPHDTEALQSILSRHGVSTGSSHDVKNAKARLQRSVKAIADELGYNLGDLL